MEEDGLWLLPEGKHERFNQELWMMGVREVRVQGLKREEERGVFPHLSEVVKEMCSEYGVRVLADEGGPLMSRGEAAHELTMMGAQKGTWGAHVQPPLPG